jgi:hypothetical protein
VQRTYGLSQFESTADTGFYEYVLTCLCWLFFVRKKVLFRSSGRRNPNKCLNGSLSSKTPKFNRTEYIIRESRGKKSVTNVVEHEKETSQYTDTRPLRSIRLCDTACGIVHSMCGRSVELQFLRFQTGRPATY